MKRRSGGVGDDALAARIVSAPRVIEPQVAQARIADWLAGIEPATAEALKTLLQDFPTVATILQSLSESSPFLWELARRESERLVDLLRDDPDRHLTTLLADTGRAVAQCEDEAQALRLLRRMKAEAALLIALADIGGVWPVMRAAHALTDLADTAVNAAVRFAFNEAARAGRIVVNDPAEPERGSGYIVLAMGKMGAVELNYSSDI
ncbi:MAG TPA: bifunctional [glutamine synthetase] adenylyltransferase/[glutamine synthetase]-adenylyl-L-tyrosine phosphorylase, partial [Pseudolabrys sp.]|nr:bifunctional [glutamine synthetase] adenylyltransferase/[glutamine synthetase]-adenylyl-L-tyrosine phosphorylase [Pseudolabrys sp.]